jgi:hypothetical protein
LTGNSDWVWSLAVLQNGDLASGSWDETISIWHSFTVILKNSSEKKIEKILFFKKTQKKIYSNEKNKKMIEILINIKPGKEKRIFNANNLFLF